MTDESDAKPLLLKNSDIEFVNVSFGYKGRKADILNNLDLTIKSGQTIGIVGPSGAGKSTILRLLLRSYDPQLGIIKIGDQDIKKVTQESLREAIGFVPQETVLFNTTILENVRYARLAATDEDIYSACKQADIYDKIMSLPSGYLTRVGKKGSRLSGGEAQRLAIARVFLKNPSIVLLDEATSALDSKTEERVQKALSVLGKGRTMIVVAHRLASVRDADMIVVVEGGKVVEGGAHEELMEKKGRYSGLWERQVNGKEDEDET